MDEEFPCDCLGKTPTGGGIGEIEVGCDENGDTADGLWEEFCSNGEVDEDLTN